MSKCTDCNELVGEEWSANNGLCSACTRDELSKPDTNQASELYELCKEVYKRTGWKYTIGRFHDDGSYDGYLGHRGVAYTPSPQDSEWLPKDIPLYTSDYLLEKLPPVVQDSYDKKFRHIQMWINGDGEARACYVEPYDKEFRGAYVAESDSMLKALLKLTIALSEAGELK